MIFSEFTNKTRTYLKSLRYLKDYASFDVYFSSTWVIPKKFVEDIEVIKQDNTDRPNFAVYSFVVQNSNDLVDKLETAIDNVIRHNREREEKERLFKEKIQELKSLFESTDVSDLKRLHFEVDEDTTLMLEVEKVEDNGQDTEGPVDMVQERETEG